MSDALKEKDAAQALGDAIRERADDLRQDSPLDQIETSVRSLGWALGASDHDNSDDAGVEIAATSVLAQYFLKSHGGAHAIQCLCSVLATVAGLGALLWPPPLNSTLTKRCLFFAMTKHVSGLLAASLLTAKAIPEVGLRQARLWMEQLVRDPVSQYVFYCACLMVWLPPDPVGCWWQSYPMVSMLLVGPVLLREVVSSALVVSDVLVLWSLGSSNNNLRHALSVAQSGVDVGMSLLVTPSVWRSASAAQKQAILAKLTSRVSLALEVAVGLLLALDATRGIVEFTFAASSKRPAFVPLVRRVLCTRLFLHFLWTRRRKISRLGVQIRGGAAQLPFYVLEVLLDPRKSMGLEEAERRRPSWQEFVTTGLDLERSDQGKR